jgi:membrane fusion protein (multidrug efflux system)
MRKIIILAGYAVVFALASCGAKHDQVEHESTYLVTNPVEKDTIVYEEYVSQIHSIQHIELRALEKGYLQNVFVDEGQHVKKGQLMFRIMPLIYEAEMQKAKAEASFAEIEYLNTKSLADSNIVSSNELALAKAQLDKANAELSLAQAHLGFTEIRAPFDGIMGRFHVRLGSLLDEGELLATLSDNSDMWVYFNVPEAQYLDFVSTTSLDSLPEVYLHMANQKPFDTPGIITTIESDFNNETGNIAFRATFPNKKGILRHGETGNIQLPVHFPGALLIPQKATFEVLDKKFVFVVTEEGVLESREITIAAELPHLYLVSSGLDTNDKILIEGLRKVVNGQKIEFEVVGHDEVMSELNGLHAE